MSTAVNCIDRHVRGFSAAEAGALLLALGALVGALLMGSDGGFITGSDFLIDGGVTAAYWYGDLAPK